MGHRGRVGWVKDVKRVFVLGEVVQVALQSPHHHYHHTSCTSACLPPSPLPLLPTNIPHLLGPADRPSLTTYSACQPSKNVWGLAPGMSPTLHPEYSDEPTCNVLCCIIAHHPRCAGAVVMQGHLGQKTRQTERLQGLLIFQRQGLLICARGECCGQEASPGADSQADTWEVAGIIDFARQGLLIPRRVECCDHGGSPGIEKQGDTREVTGIIKFS